MPLSSLLTPYFFFLFLFVVPPQFSDAQSNRNYRDCATPFPFECGNLGIISFPFLAGNRPASCGYPGFELACENNSPSIEIGSEKFRLREINYTARVMSIAPRYDHEHCPRPNSRDNRIDATRIFNFTEEDEILSLHYDCSPEIRDLGFFEIPCLRGFFNGPSYYSSMANFRARRSWGGRCQDPVYVRVLKGGLARLTKNPSDYAEIVKQGFEVKWIVGSGWCNECNRSGGICGYNQSFPEQTTCFCPDTTRYASCAEEEGSRARMANELNIGLLSAGVGGFFVFFAVLFIYVLRKECFCSTYGHGGYTYKERLFFWRTARSISGNVEVFLENYGSSSPKRYKYSHIKKITDSFKEKLGQGGYGAVYKGKLADGTLVAVKLLNETKAGNGEEFMNEVASIGRTSHVNVVNLMGFCSEGPKRALVYEFLPNGSLEKYIYSTTQDHYSKSQITSVVPHLGWEKLYQIAVDIARGLEYLHRGCATRILHLDIKPHNILLDRDFCPKISDFGMAKLCSTRDSIVSMPGTRGTVGYIAPEVFCRNFGGVSHKSDVYSYGMMVLEMVGGRKNINPEVENTSEIYFPDWIYKRLIGHQSINISVGLVRGDQEINYVAAEEEEKVRKMILVGIWCIQTNPANRPSMSRVLDMLEGNLEAIEIPPKPYLSSPPRSLDQLASSIP
ncbi:hypothetical protein H6P81_010458 [Aristolochia fimbriata]|uniref:non-specific serine/threonine protein kinase n=1 Tax=Aristolochia fimbriata TaxID=158543 RepID=A0AAV7EP20_ARIFI|nr:hypothetical protein H6P81_010458 [Aristolochia fimbriata]